MENTIKFSVLMSIYYKEKPEYLRQCLDSIINQTCKPSEIVIVKDGKLTKQLEDVLFCYKENHSEMFRFIELEKNCGLGLALAVGVKACKNELIARMDTDDISVKNRFEIQIEEFRKNPNLDICGGYIEEFDFNPNRTSSIRKVPLSQNEICKYQKRRDAFNHVTVMFKKSKVLEAGNYQHALLMEDSLLWSNMLMKKANCMNIGKTLVLVRTNDDMFMRRGGLDYVKKYARGRMQVRKTGFINMFDVIYTVLIQFVFSMVPNSIRKNIYKLFLRR